MRKTEIVHCFVVLHANGFVEQLCNKTKAIEIESMIPIFSTILVQIFYCVVHLKLEIQ